MTQGAWPQAAKCLLAAAALMGGLAAQASPITYTFAGMASGTFTPSGGSGTVFSNQAFQLTFVTDTSNIGVWFPGVLHMTTPATASISISTLGSGSVVTAMSVFANLVTNRIGVGTLSGDWFHLQPTASLAGYGLVTDIGPLSGATSFLTGSTVALDFGRVSLSSLGSLSFQATAVPEPETWALMGVGLAGVVLLARRRRAH